MAGRTLGSRLHLEPFTPDRAAGDGDRQAVLLALVAQQPQLGRTALVFALTVLPAILFLGLVTYVRVLQSSIEDILYAMYLRESWTQLLFTLPSAVLAVHVAYQAHRFTRMKATVEALFPTGAAGR
jgi:hypothetical protein